MASIFSVFHFFVDQRTKLTHKSLLIIVSVALLIIVDNTLNFTQHYNNNRKLEQIDRINKILEYDNLSNEERLILREQRLTILKHKTWRDKAYEYATTFNVNRNIAPEKTGEISNVPTIQTRDYWSHFVSSSWIIVIAMILMPIGAFASKTNNFITNLALLLLVVEPILFAMAWIFAKVFSYIPVIADNVNINYIINAVLHLGFFLLFRFVPTKKITK